MRAACHANFGLNRVFMGANYIFIRFELFIAATSALSEAVMISVCIPAPQLIPVGAVMPM